jgi:putative hydrolase of the HAD superfamily
MIKAIFLDIGGVLILSKYREVIEKWAEELDVPPDKLRQTLKDYSHISMTGQRGSYQEFIKSKRITWITAEKLETLQKDAWNSEYLNKELLDFILENKEKYTFGIITNNYREAEQLLLKKFSVPKFYNVFVSSADIGVLKPDKRIYQHAFEQARVPAEQSIFIDDQEENVKGASEVGMFRILYKDNTSLFKRIAEISNQ